MILYKWLPTCENHKPPLPPSNISQRKHLTYTVCRKSNQSHTETKLQRTRKRQSPAQPVPHVKKDALTQIKMSDTHLLHSYDQLSRYVFLLYLIWLAWDHQPRLRIHLAFSGNRIWIWLAPLTLSHTARLGAMAQRGDTWDMERERVETILACLLSSTEPATLSLFDIFASTPLLPSFFPPQLLKKQPRFYKCKKKKSYKCF